MGYTDPLSGPKKLKRGGSCIEIVQTKFNFSEKVRQQT